jgi:hypothetical protein
MCSPRVFPIAPYSNPIYFAQSPTLLTYIVGPKGEALHLSIESFILESLHFILPLPPQRKCEEEEKGTKEQIFPMIIRKTTPA